MVFPISAQRAHDDEPVASQTRAIDWNHQPGKTVDGHTAVGGGLKPLEHGREVVVAHDGLQAPGHSGGHKAPRIHNSERHAPAAKANAQFNQESCCGPIETHDPAALAGAGVVKSN